MTSLETVRQEVKADITLGSARGQKGINAFACICGEKGKINRAMYRLAIEEWCQKEGCERDAFTTRVTGWLMLESFTIWVDTDQWSSVNTTCEDPESVYKDLKFSMQCDLLDHGYLFLILAFEEWAKENNVDLS